MRHWTIADIPDLRGRTALVTGANSGLGLETTRALATKGAFVVMACRNQEKGRQAKVVIEESVPEAHLAIWNELPGSFCLNGIAPSDDASNSSKPCDYHL